MGRKLATLAAVVVALVAVVGAGATLWDRGGPDDRGIFCTAGGTWGPPSASPEDAFDAWWDLTYPDEPDGPSGTVDRANKTTWDLDRGTPEWERVTVGHERLGDGTQSTEWQVTGANSCHYFDPDQF